MAIVDPLHEQPQQHSGTFVIDVDERVGAVDVVFDSKHRNRPKSLARQRPREARWTGREVQHPWKRSL